MQIDGHQADGYRPISDYALIGNTFTAALVAPDGTIDWCCLPYFDGGAVFCRLLDWRRGGFFRLSPTSRSEVHRSYLDGSAVLTTEFWSGGGQMRLTDCMPAPPLDVDGTGPPVTQRCMLLRRIEGLQGVVEVELLFKPTMDFARQRPVLQLVPGGCRVIALDGRLRLDVPAGTRLQLHDGAAHACLHVRAGQVLWLALSLDDGGPPPQAAQCLLEETLRRWRHWDAQRRYRGPYEQEVARSSRVLKLLTFAPSGAIVAAPTTSLPECIGGERNWDYRFCWLRDASLVLHALMSIGHDQAAHRFFQWLTSLWRSDRRLQIMYRIDGDERLPEVDLRHLEGYRGSRPVRVGNGAAQQVQLDIYGHLLDAAWVYLRRRAVQVPADLAQVLAFLADAAARHWRDPDQGLWEMRKAPAHHVSSKLQCWVALDRALKLVQAGHLAGDVATWAREREAVRIAILAHGFNRHIGAFTQLFGDTALDASVLTMPIVGFLPAGDPRMRSTVERLRKQLMQRGLVYRYRRGDGLPDGEGSFAICTFWMVDNLALQGRVAEARELFEHVVSFANDLGLMSEEIDPDNGQLLGNFPQGYTHLALIRSALTISAAERTGCQGRGQRKPNG